MPFLSPLPRSSGLLCLLLFLLLSPLHTHQFLLSPVALKRLYCYMSYGDKGTDWRARCGNLLLQWFPNLSFDRSVRSWAMEKD